MMSIGSARSVPSAWVENTAEYLRLLEGIGDIYTIVEVGVHYGYSLFTFAHDHPNAVVVGVDNFSYGDSKDAERHLANHLPEFKNIRMIALDSATAASWWGKPENYLDIDVLHIDAGHQYHEVKNDFELWSKFVRPGGVILFHDIRSFPNDVGRFFDELVGRKDKIDFGAGLGAFYKDD